MINTSFQPKPVYEDDEEPRPTRRRSKRPTQRRRPKTTPRRPVFDESPEEEDEAEDVYIPDKRRSRHRSNSTVLIPTQMLYFYTLFIITYFL